MQGVQGLTKPPSSTSGSQRQLQHPEHNRNTGERSEPAKAAGARSAPFGFTSPQDPGLKLENPICTPSDGGEMRDITRVPRAKPGHRAPGLTLTGTRKTQEWRE